MFEPAPLRTPVMAVRINSEIGIPRRDVDLDPQLDDDVTTTELAKVATFVIVFPLAAGKWMQGHGSVTLVFVDVATKRVVGRKYFDGDAIPDGSADDVVARYMTELEYWRAIASYVDRHLQR
jgi:hypothetical protein